ncbi:D-glucuronyl C5-epimerase family protein [Allopusillimonas ginsengisoli]|uniref:D-glucuronyl C5-epimerase family protein n=1 Tax=Allopusillimonas ginsengisoli TaxID=453575 RepID=UPI00102090AD|nr:D-glucuronyl C5-epimerase family protein [Allopusillimonas ginsengisoli]TEA77864.1 hypothetical protein ERE07_12660 [Allopusillimonas ginsengisoli]
MKIRKTNLLKINCLIIVLFYSILFSQPSKALSVKECLRFPIAPRTLNAAASEYASSGKFGLDENGILVFDYGTAYDGLGKFRNPYFISNYANALYRDYLNTKCQDDELKNQFLMQADYLMRSAIYENDMALWQYPFKNDAFNLPPGWISGIGQARIASVLVRAFGMTGDEKYKKVAYDGMEVYKHGLINGGVVSRDKDVTWIEETPSHDGTSYKILNGHITALSGILDFAGLTNDSQWEDLYQRGIAAVRRDLPLFDAGFTSYYSLGQSGIDRLVAPRGDYNALHVDQLLWLYEHTEDSFFLEWASIFQAYELNGFTYTAKGSVDPVNHGPSQAASLYGNKYWSHAQFPTWIQVDLPEKSTVEGIWIDGNGEKASPRDFSVQAMIDGQWKELSNIKNNQSKRVVLHWSNPVSTQSLRLNIENDNGNKNVALQSVAPLISKKRYAAITNACNYKIRGDFHYNVNAVLDGDDRTSMTIYCPGWIIVPNMKNKNNLLISALGPEDAVIEIYYSMMIGDWKPLGKYRLDDLKKIRLPKNRFIEIKFGNELTEIKSISLS